MASDVAVVALTYRGTDIQNIPGGIFLEIVEGLNEPPSVRGSDWTVPGAPGRQFRSRVADVRTIELRGYVSGEGVGEAADRSDFATLRETMRALFDPTLDPGVLAATLENGAAATINARSLPTQVWDQVVPAMFRVSIELESVDPDWDFGGGS